jgi:hypothetical protein
MQTVTAKTPIDSPPIAFSEAEVMKIAQHFRLIKTTENGDGCHSEFCPISETSSFHCPACKARLWLLDFSSGPRSSQFERITCHACGRVARNRFFVSE